MKVSRPLRESKTRSTTGCYQWGSTILTKEENMRRGEKERERERELMYRYVTAVSVSWVERLNCPPRGNEPALLVFQQDTRGMTNSLMSDYTHTNFYTHMCLLLSLTQFYSPSTKKLHRFTLSLFSPPSIIFNGAEAPSLLGFYSTIYIYTLNPPSLGKYYRLLHNPWKVQDTSDCICNHTLTAAGPRVSDFNAHTAPLWLDGVLREGTTWGMKYGTFLIYFYTGFFYRRCPIQAENFLIAEQWGEKTF